MISENCGGISAKTNTPLQPNQRAFIQLANLSPAYFGMVMATGIVSLAAYLMAMPTLAKALLLLNSAAYVALVCLNGMRLVRYPQRFFGDMIDHLRGPGFFTVVAATGILGVQFVVFTESYRLGFWLWLVTLLLWFGFTYVIFIGFTIKKIKPTLDKGISGAWLLAVVATQSIATLSALLAVHISPSLRLEMNFLALSMWLWGGMLYIWMMSLIFYRYTFFPLSADDLSPTYWINMGAMAISTLAGSLLIINATDAPYLNSLLPFIKGFTVFYWAAGTWWIPMLVILAFWRHLYKRFPLKYDPQYWAAVFPLGMYSVCTHQMSEAMGFNFLWFLPPAFFYIALAAWTAMCVGLVLGLISRARIA